MNYREQVYVCERRGKKRGRGMREGGGERREEGVCLREGDLLPGVKSGNKCVPTASEKTGGRK